MFKFVGWTGFSTFMRELACFYSPSPSHFLSSSPSDETIYIILGGVGPFISVLISNVIRRVRSVSVSKMSLDRKELSLNHIVNANYSPGQTGSKALVCTPQSHGCLRVSTMAP